MELSVEKKQSLNGGNYNQSRTKDKHRKGLARKIHWDVSGRKPDLTRLQTEFSANSLENKNSHRTTTTVKKAFKPIVFKTPHATTTHTTPVIDTTLTMTTTPRTSKPNDQKSPRNGLLQLNDRNRCLRKPRRLSVRRSKRRERR